MEQILPIIIGAFVFASGVITGSALTQAGRKKDDNE